jgi:hypothetical protein
MRCECGHDLVHVAGTVEKIRTRMILLRKSVDGDVLACVCPSCKSDVVIGFLSDRVDKASARP